MPVTTAFAPQSRNELKADVGACVGLSPVGNCSAGSHGPIGSWNVSAVTDVNGMFADVHYFNLDLFKWDVLRSTKNNVLY